MQPCKLAATGKCPAAQCLKPFIRTTDGRSARACRTGYPPTSPCPARGRRGLHTRSSSVPRGLWPSASGQAHGRSRRRMWCDSCASPRSSDSRATSSLPRLARALWRRLVPEMIDVAINRDTVAMSSPLARQGSVSPPGLCVRTRRALQRAPDAVHRYGTDAAAGRSHVALIPTEPPLSLSRTRIRAPLARTPTMSANLVMSDDLSRANAMDRPIVGPLFVLSDYSSRSQLRAAISS